MSPRLPARWVRVWRYTAGSAVAAATSAVAFALAYAAGLGTAPANVIAFVAGAVPNWVLNRSWAWQRRGRVRVGREVVLYTVVSLVSLVASWASTRWTDQHVPAVTDNHTVRVVLVAGAYVATYGILFVAKYLLYERVIFAGDDPRPRSRHQVSTTTRPNRSP